MNKRFTLCITLLAAALACARAQVGGQMEIKGDYEFITDAVSPDGVAHVEVALWYDEPSHDNNTIDVYDENMNKVKSIQVKVDEFEEGSIYSKFNEATGEWEVSDDTRTTRTYGPENIALEPYDGVYCYLTQHVFNADDAYEYVMPLRETVVREETGYMEKRARVTGFAIMSEDGTVLQTVSFNDGDKYSYFDCSLYRLGANIYLEVEAGSGMEGDDRDYLYRVSNSSTGVGRLESVMTVNVTPRMAGRDECFTVDLGTDDTGRTVTVTDSAGQTLWRQTVPAGQRQVSISAARLSKGINVINVSGRHKDSCKVIVK